MLKEATSVTIWVYPVLVFTNTFYLPGPPVTNSAFYFPYRQFREFSMA